MKITAVGTDLSKNVFQIHGVDERGRARRPPVSSSRRARRSAGFERIQPIRPRLHHHPALGQAGRAAVDRAHA